MRKEIHWAIALFLATTTVVTAEESSKPPIPQTLPDVNADVLRAPEPSRTVMTPQEANVYSLPPAEKPLSFWVNTDYLLWRVKNGPVSTPLVTASNSLTDQPPGALNQPGTRILYGDRPIDYGTFSGFRIGAGVELASGLALEGGYFFLERRTAGFRASSDSSGAPLLAHPFFNTGIGSQDALLISNPDPATGIFAGTTAIHSHTRLQSWELNLAALGYGSESLRFKALAGFRTLSLDEDLTIQDQLNPLADGVLTYLGVGIPAGSTLGNVDRFQTGNRFYGGQIGGQLQWQQGRFSADLQAKIALGVNQQTVIIDGSSFVSIPGVGPGAGFASAPGGLFAQGSNIGRHSRNTFAVVPEGGLNIGYNITPRIKATVGYTFVYWSRVVRPGAQIDPSVNQTVIPTHQNFGLNAPDGRPAFNFRETDFWAQGVNFGLEFKF
jgi:Putative beta barrel porin-7 (BBP7)